MAIVWLHMQYIAVKYCGSRKWKKINQKPTLRSTPNFVPNRMLRTAYGAWLILSEPPHRTTSESFRQISYKHTQGSRFLFWKIKTKGETHYHCICGILFSTIHPVAPLLGAPVQSNAFQYNSTATTSFFTNFMMFSFWWHCQTFVNSIICLFLRS